MDVSAFILFNINSVLMICVVWRIKHTTASKETIFSKRTTCKLQTLVNLTCARRHGTRFKSLIECASDCANEAGCLGVSTDDGSCFYHYKCSQNVTCGASDLKFEVYVKHDPVAQATTTTATIPQCQHDGIWNLTRNACHCNSGWVGQFCERYGTSCKDLALNGYTQGWPDGVLWATIRLTATSTPVKVLCELRETYFNTYILRNDGWTDLRTTQPTQYMNGFNVSNYCYFLGLNNMKAFNDAGYTTLKLDVGFSLPPDDSFHLFQMTYNDFKLKGTSENFKFTFTSIVRKKEGIYSDNFTNGDCLGPLEGANFASPSDEEDSSAEACAQTAGVGWWYDKDCKITCNPLGYKKLKDPNRQRTEYIIMDGLNCENTESCNVAIYFVMK